MSAQPIHAPRDLRSIRPEDLAYLAGIIDGEGWIGVARSGKHFHLRLVVGSNDRVLVDWLAAKTGRGVIRAYDRGGNRKRTYQWTCFGTVASAVLQVVFPFIVVNHLQAEIGVRFYLHGIDKRPLLGDELQRLNSGKGGRMNELIQAELATEMVEEDATAFDFPVRVVADESA